MNIYTVIQIIAVVGMVAILARFIVQMRRINRRSDAAQKHADDALRSAEAMKEPRERVKEYQERAARRGACGIRGCPIMTRHSHAADLRRRLREDRERGR